MHAAPGHRQLRRRNREGWILSPQRTPLDQRTRRIIGHRGDHLGAGEQRAQPAELRHAKHHPATAADLRQVKVDVTAQVTGKRHHGMRSFAVLIEGQRSRPFVAAQHLAGDVAQLLAFGIRRQIRGVAHPDGNFTGGQQGRHQQVIGTPHHHDDPRRLFLQLPQQWREQAELGIVRQADTKHVAAGRRIELLGPADRPGDNVHRRLQLLENRQRPRRRLHATTVAQQQRIIEQVAQTTERRTDRRLPHEQFFGDPGQVLLEHQGLKNNQQVHVDATQIVTVHWRHLDRSEMRPCSAARSLDCAHLWPVEIAAMC